MFNIGLYKTNKKYLLFAIGLIFLLIFLNSFLNSKKVLTNELNNIPSNINKLVINEIMTSNKGALVDDEGNNYDWIELYNGYDYDIDLTNYGLSDEDNGKVKWGFPDVTIKSHSYMIIYLTGKKQSGLNANFSLNQDGGELITLRDTKKKVIDSVRTISLEKNSSMARDSKGKWTTTKEITPGYENSENGRNDFLNRLIDSKQPQKLILTEFLPSNEGNVIFYEDKLYSYVEVTNNSENTIKLNDYYLSDDFNVIYKWRFPNVELKSGDVYLVYMNNLNKDNNASFDLKHKAGSLILSTYNGVVEKIEYEQLTNGVAYIKKNNKWYQNIDISPGYSNNDNGKQEFNKNNDVPNQGLIINEVMSSNNKYLPQNCNQYYDWIELYNNSSTDINLGDYSITTDYNDKKMYTLPKVTLAPNSYYIIMASGDESLSNEMYKHLNFKLSSGTGLFLYKDTTLMDSIYIYGIPKGNSYGRNLEGGHFYYDRPTPLNYNINGINEISYAPVFSIKGGVYNNVDNIIVSLEGNGQIYYTLDGSEPTNKSNKYINPIELKNTTVIRAISYENNKKSSEIITNSYIINENHTIPIMSISMPSNSFNSIQSSPYGKLMVKSHAELYEDNTNFSMDCDFKLFGGESRTLSKKSFALKFNYGHLKYKVFDNKDIYEFNTLVLRSGSQDQNKSMMRDELLTSIASKYGTLDAQAYKPIVLYINGNYWGVYYIREKIENDFIENNYNISGQTNIISYNYVAEEGNNNDIVKLKNYIKNHDMRNDENYKYVSTLLDIDNYIDFWVYQFILNNIDLHNIRYYNNINIYDNKIRMILYDLDYGIRSNYGVYYLNFMQYPIGLLTPVDNSILSNLMKNNTFKNKFIERAFYYLKNVWTPQNINNEFEFIYNTIKPEMERNQKRWNISYDNWDKEAISLKNESLNRYNSAISIIKSYFKLSQEEIDAYLR